MKRYLTDAGEDKELAQLLYVWNVELTASFMESFHHVEVLLRNKIHVKLSESTHRGWLRDKSILTEESIERVDIAVTRIRKAGLEPTHGQVVANLHFGFWVALFDRHYDELWTRHLHKVFRPHGPPLRKTVARRMGGLRTFRNRLAHHEPIYRDNIEARHNEILVLAAWLDPGARTWVSDLSRTPNVMERRPI